MKKDELERIKRGEVLKVDMDYTQLKGDKCPYTTDEIVKCPLCGRKAKISPDGQEFFHYAQICVLYDNTNKRPLVTPLAIHDYCSKKKKVKDEPFLI